MEKSLFIVYVYTDDLFGVCSQPVGLCAGDPIVPDVYPPLLYTLPCPFFSLPSSQCL